ncbi:protein GLUTAMINE DUMPER 2-like [Lolium rigidum]|uniref:protein GLUTAMINE DUMPER 2-like n=1 Tax=Lolium rigidum TaxID=89674 RepID=UPI001F5CBD70|nr:protein GLUTAMINE DUMPER 2-like [Lolium rigidum]
MRPGAEYPMAHVPAAASSAAAPRSPWQSPVPYLFGGLAAMLGLIALSLVALACSYWNLSGGDPLTGQGGDDQADGEKRSVARLAGEWQGHVVVIMAGDEHPTFLATPATTTGRDAEGGAEQAADATACCAACRSEERKMAGARVAGTRPAGYEDDAHSRSEQASSSTSSVIS